MSINSTAHLLTFPNDTFNSQRVEIGNTELISKNVNTFEMLGMNLEAWYYMDEKVSDDKELTEARLFLCTAVKNTIKNILVMLKVDVPEAM